MALTVFQNQNTTYSNKDQFIIDSFSDTDMDIGLFFEVSLNGVFFDCLILSPKGLSIIEYQECSGRLETSDFEDWIIEDSKNNLVNIGNPIEKIKSQRFALMNFFNDNQQEKLNKIFINKMSGNLDIRHISFFLFFDSLYVDSNISLSKKISMWFECVSKKTFVSEFDALRTSQFTFSLDEIQRFSNVVEISKIKNEQISIESKYCFVCDYSARKCDQKNINGYIVDIVDNIITVQARNDKFLIEYQKSDLSELQLIKDFYLNVHMRMKVNFEVNLLHLIRPSDGGSSSDFIITDYTIVTIQPSWLVNVTDFTTLSFCERQAITKQFSKNPINEPILKGISVNEAIKDLIPDPDNILTKKDRIHNAYQSVGRYLRNNIIECGVVGIDSGQPKEDFKDKIKSEIKNIVNWIDNRDFKGRPKFEEFIISPELGLRGKLDIVFKENDEILDIIELKSSKKDYFTNGIQFYHELQVVAYCMMVMLKQKKKLDQSAPSVIYSRASVGIETNATLNFETFSNVSKFRNILLSSSIGLKLPMDIDDHHAKYKKKCIACSNSDIYKNISMIKKRKVSSDNQGLITKSKIDNFEYWYDFLNSSKIDSYLKYNNLMHKSVESRKQKGKLIEGEFVYVDKVFNQWKYNVLLSDNNQSDFRDKDLVLIMEKENYYDGAVKVAEIDAITNSKCEILVNEKIDFQPRFIATYYNDSSDKINNIGLYNAFFENDKIYRLFYDKVDASYNDLIEDLDVNLILGPPGSGKTTTICNKIIDDINNDRTVFVMCFTNRALDEIEDRLAKNNYFNQNNFQDIVYRFNRKKYHSNNANQVSSGKIKVFLSTVHGTRSEIISKWQKQFDVCYIDEASQLNFTMCANGFLGKKNILVGDFNQLPPLISTKLSSKFDTNTIKNSFFENLWDKIAKDNIGGRCEYLKVQYRMNKEIAAYPFSKWYGDFNVQNFKEIADGRLDYKDDNWENDDFREILDPENPSLWVQVDSVSDNQDKRVSIDEAKACSQIIEKFIEYGQDINEKIGVIAPFRRQVNEIKNLVSLSVDDVDKKLIDTVDRFQGSQKEIVIISICSGENDNFLETDYRRLNVALTRSRFKRIIVGDMNKAGKDLREILNDGYTQKIHWNKS